MLTEMLLHETLLFIFVFFSNEFVNPFTRNRLQLQSYRYGNIRNIERKDNFLGSFSNFHLQLVEKKLAMIGIRYISIRTYRSLGTNCVAHCRWTDRMNGYDAIMQGRHGLRNMTQPSDTDYYRCIRLEGTTRARRRGNEWNVEKERERKGEIRHELYRPRILRFVGRLREFLWISISLYGRNDFTMHAPSDEKRAILVKQLSRARKSDADRDLCACSVCTNELHVVHSKLKCPR